MSLVPSSRHGASPPEEDQDDDIVNEVIMAIEMKNNNTVGCAYYVTVEETLCLQEDIPMAGIEIVETLILQAQPTTVIINNRAPSKMADYLEAHAQDLDGSQVGGLNGVYILRTVGASDFNAAIGQQKLASLDSKIFGEQPTILTAVTAEVDGAEAGEADTTKQSKLMRLSTIVNLESRLSIGCAGAVLNELQRRRVVEFLPDDPHAELAFCVKRINMFTLGNSMFVNADTLVSLQILGSEHHPNSQMQGPDRSKQGAKEDLSVYGLVKTLACTTQGKAKLRQMFLRPTNDLDLIRERHRSIAVFLRPANTAVLEDITKMLRKVKDIRGTVANLSKGVHQTTRIQGVKSGVWLTLLRFAHAAIELIGLVHNLTGAQSLDIMSKIMTTINPRGIRDVGEMISRNIDFEKSADAQRTTVKWGVDADLDGLMHLFDGLEDILARVRARLVQVMPDWARDYLVNCIFYPQLGFLVAIQLDPRTGKGLYQGEGLADDEWVSMFTNDGLVLYKTRMMLELDATYGDPYGQLVDREIEIVHQLGVRVLEHAEHLTAASDLFGELDSLIALALTAEKYQWTEPEMTLSNTIDIREGRHPLQELVVPSFIANDCHLSGGLGTGPGAGSEQERQGPSMLILTGPNHSGKSVYLKQVALIVYLAHVGSFVPAAGGGGGAAVVGLTDKMLTRVATRESTTRGGGGESAFAIDLRQAASCLRHATRRSLVLVDEFGKGTAAADGAGLMAALLDHFLALGEALRPKVLVATHFHEIFEHGFLAYHERAGSSPLLAFAHMEVRLDRRRRRRAADEQQDEEGEEEEEEATALFRLAPGRSTASYGTRCAALNGVAAAVVERAEALAALLARGGGGGPEDLRAACARLAPAEERRLEEAERVARRFVGADLPDPEDGRLPGGRGRAGAGPAGSVRALLGELLGLGGGGGSGDGR